MDDDKFHIPLVSCFQNSDTVAVAVFQADGSLLYANGFYKRSFGGNQFTERPNRFIDAVFPEDVHLLKKAVSHADWKTSQPVRVQLRMKLSKSAEQVIAVSWEFFGTTAEKPDAPLLITGLGVPQSPAGSAPHFAKQAQGSSPQLNGQKFVETLVHALNDHIFVLDREGTYLDIRGERETLFLPADEFIGRKIADFFPEESTTLVLGRIAACLNGAASEPVIIPIPIQGKITHYECRFAKYDDSRVVVLARDCTDRIRSEEEREKLLAEYEALFDSNHAAIFLVQVNEDGSFTYLRTNNTHINATGLIPEMIWHKTPEEALGEELGSVISANYRNCVEQGKTILYEEELQLPAGTKTWLTALTPVKRDGNITYIIGSAADVTLLKQNETALIRQNQQLEQMSKISLLGGFEFSLQDNSLSWTRMTKQIHGVPVDFEPTLEQAINFYATDEDREKIAQAVSEAINFGKPYDLELQIRDGNGSVKWIRTIGKADFTEGRCVRIFGTFQDIDRQKRLELLSQANEERYTQILNAAPTGMVVISDQKIRYINPAGLSIFGAHSYADFAEVSLRELVHPDDFLEGSLKVLALMKGNKVQFPHELRLIKRDGTCIDAELTASVLPSVDQPALLIMFSDVSESKRNRESIEAQNRVLRQIAWEQSHVVRAPVSRLMSLADAIETGDYRFLSLKEMLGGIVRSAVELDGIIREISDKANRLLHPESYDSPVLPKGTDPDSPAA